MVDLRLRVYNNGTSFNQKANHLGQFLRESVVVYMLWIHVNNQVWT